MEIRGTVEGLIFRNAENGYTVAAVDVHGLVITAVGIFPPITEGEEVYLQGEYKKNPRFGDQFVVTQVIVAPPNGRGNMIRYLSGGLFPGIGEVTATAIVDHFGRDTFDIIEFNFMRLTEVRGISTRKASAISTRYAELRRMQRAIMFLTEYHVSLNLAIKIYKYYEDLTESVVKTNPYKLVEDIEGIGFRTADTIALAMGIAKDDTNRVRAAIRHNLDDGANRLGHTYLPYGRLVAMTLKLLEFDESYSTLVIDTVESMEIVGDVVRIVEADDNAGGIMLAKHYHREQNIARRLLQLMQEAPVFHFEYEREIKFFQKAYGITLHPTQMEAVTAALNNGGVVITGGPGTGKTTIIKCIIHLLERAGTSYVLTAPTGRAAKRMSQATERVAKTIHRLLEMNPKSGGNSFVYNEHNALPFQVAIVDEISMADESIFYALLRALPRGAKLILVGDKDQLPSVGAGSVLADIIESGIMPVVQLNHIYRQAEGSFIITNAHLINKGTLPDPDRTSKDFFFDYTEDEGRIMQDVVQFCTTRIGTYLPVTSREIQVLAPLKKGEVGVNRLNEQLQAALNPPAPFKKEITVGTMLLREGDRVIQTCNNYEINWVHDDSGVVNTGTGVFNGDVGIIEQIDRGNMQVTVRFEDDRVATYGADEVGDMALAYAISVHKSQGSEFRVVVVVASQYNPMVLTKNLLYTAVTRAKEMVVLVGNKKTYQYMVRNKKTETRYTALVRFIRQLQQEGLE